MLRVRRHTACHRKRTCAGRGQALDDGESGRAGGHLPVRPGRQGHAHTAEDTVGQPRIGPFMSARQGLPGEQISTAIRRAHARGNPALVAYLTAGYPSMVMFTEHVRAIAANADVVEIGVPFTDPMADGVTIQRSSQGALAQGVSLRWILSELTNMPKVGVPLLLMSYLNPLLAFGVERLPDAAAKAGVNGFIVPDLPVDESDLLKDALASQGIALVQMVTPVTTPERLERVVAG